MQMGCWIIEALASERKGQMTTDFGLPAQFEAVKDRDEQVLWIGKPNFTAFIIRGIPFLCIGVLWGAIDYFGFIRNMDKEMSGFTIPFFILHLFPFWGSILNMIRLFLVHGNTCHPFSLLSGCLIYKMP